MYTKVLLLSAFSSILASTLPLIEPFSQGGCATSYTGPLKFHQQDISYKCFIPTVTGKCRGSNDSYHYNVKTGQCEKALFGGCNDGCQAFDTKSNCEYNCVKFTIDPVDPTGMPSFSQSQCKVSKPKTMKKKFEDVPARCFVKTETGKCRMGVESYHFDIATEKCIKSTFGGCDDGCLGFKTIEDCQNTCNRFSIDV